ncbi:MAG: DUF624 domain-containing protein [Ruminiclostridium sp.]
MGFLSSNYNKPGPGVDKDAPKKPSFFIFFEVLKRKFWHLIKINLMFVIFSIPTLVIAYFMSSVYVQKLSEYFLNNVNVTDGVLVDFNIKLILSVVMIMLSVITIGPVQAGFTYILRNYSREEHSFIWWDFKENFGKNFKQGMAITGIDIVVIYVLGIALNFYASSSNIISIAAASFVILSIIVFLMMHLYIYPMLVTVKLSVKNIYKNAFIFSIIKFLPNILILILNLVIAVAAFYNIMIGALLYVILLPSFIGLMNNFYVNPIIKKYVVNPTLSEEVEEDEDEEDDDTESFYRKEIDITDANEIDNDTDFKSLPSDDDFKK